MTLTGSVRKGYGIDSERTNWSETSNFFGFTPYNGTLNIHLDEKISISKLNYEFEIFDRFRVTKGLLKHKNKEIEVWVGYKYNMGSMMSLFLISEHRLRDELQLKTGDKVEVTL